ncbi:MAG: prolyl oligopeptidase family serine peptidase [Bacteroidaceae bacterium]|nr:prolyl oligopeptidase family serine peptidase [Bacteroidaceae bacterium]
MKKTFFFLIYHFFIISIAAQGTLEDYNRAYALQRSFSWSKVKNHVDDARWMSDDRFQYHLTDGDKGVWHFGQVNPDGSITLADSTADRPLESSSSVRARRFPRRDNANPIRFVTNPSKRRHERHWMETDDERSGDPVFSPDSSLVAFIRNDNVYVAKPDGSETRAISTEGTLSHYFSSYIQWSPDGHYLAVNRIRPIEKRYVYYVESSPSDQLQPILHKQEYAKPGDELAQKTPYIFEVASGRAVCPAPELIANQYDLSRLEWCNDSHSIRFEYNQRGHHLYRVYEMAVTGNVRTLIEEREVKYVRYSNNYRHDLYGDSLILWLSERDGFPHLYLFDTTRPVPKKKKGTSPTECLSRQLTRGNWCVRRVLHIDEEKGIIFFSANGIHPEEDPYHIHYCRVKLDGTGFTDLTPEPANHNARFNDDFSALIDTYSTQNTPPTTKIRVFGDSVAEKTLASADITDLISSGWTAPEIFVASGRDGKTPMWGIIQRPSHFDPSKKYPVIEYIYAGPGDSYTPKSFQPYNYYTSSLAELGFIVVQLDAMGTSNRGKAFEEVCYKNLKDAGFPDRIAWIKAAAEKYPYMDISRVGIYGCSAGGQESTGAVLFHGDFYKAAYSACGCHDNRMDKIWWNEQWMSYPVDSSYIECSNVENAYRLERPLMLVVGELDDNVDPASTMQVADALIKANKPFELVVIPGAHHTVGERFGEHKRFDFFVKNLLGVEPPAWSEVQSK